MTSSGGLQAFLRAFVESEVINKQRAPTGTHLPTKQETKMTITDTPTADNGVNVEALLGAREAMTGMPAAAAFTWRAGNVWVNGTHSKTTIEKFFGVGEEQSHREAFVLDTDHPEIFASEDNGVTPPEMVLAGLAGCLTAGVASVAQNRGIQLRKVTSTIEADMDLQGILGIDGDVRNGFSRHQGHLHHRCRCHTRRSPGARSRRARSARPSSTS